MTFQNNHSNNFTLESKTLNQEQESIKNAPFTINCISRIKTSEIKVSSDIRIKNVTGNSEPFEDLNTLNKIEIVDYSYIDRVSKGDANLKKVIGQQVRDVFPQVVHITKDIIPDIYQRAKNLKYEGEVLTIDLYNHGLKLGENVKLIYENGEEIVKVIGVSEDNFTVRSSIKDASWVFVYGREVNDFHTVDYEGIAMLNVSATQALTQKIDDLEIENKRKDRKIRDLTERLEKLELLVSHFIDFDNGGEHVSD